MANIALRAHSSRILGSNHPNPHKNEAALSPTEEKTAIIAKTTLNHPLESEDRQTAANIADLEGFVISTIDSSTSQLAGINLNTNSFNNQVDTGGANGFSLVNSVITLSHSVESVKSSYTQGNKPALINHISDFLESSFLTLSDAVQSGISIINVSNVSSADKALGVLGMVSTSGLVGMVSTMAVASGIKCHQLRSVSKQMSPYLDNLKGKSEQERVESFQVLSNMLVVLPEDRNNVLDQIFNRKEPWYKKNTIDIVAEKLFPGDKEKRKQLRSIFKDPKNSSELLNSLMSGLEDTSSLYPEEQQELNTFINTLLEKPEYANIKNESKDTFLKFAKILYTTGLENELERKENLFKNSFGKTVKLEIDELNRDFLSGASNPTQFIEKIDTVLISAKSSLKSQLIVSFLTVIGMALGAIALITAHFLGSGIFTLVELGISIIASLVSLGISAYRVYSISKDKTINSEHKFLIISSAVLSLILTTITTAIGKIATNSAVGVGILAAWVLLGLYSIYVWKATSSSDEIPSPITKPKETPPDSAYASDASLNPNNNSITQPATPEPAQDIDNTPSNAIDLTAKRLAQEAINEAIKELTEENDLLREVIDQ